MVQTAHTSTLAHYYSNNEREREREYDRKRNSERDTHALKPIACSHYHPYSHSPSHPPFDSLSSISRIWVPIFKPPPPSLTSSLRAIQANKAKGVLPESPSENEKKRQTPQNRACSSLDVQPQPKRPMDTSKHMFFPTFLHTFPHFAWNYVSNISLYHSPLYYVFFFF